MADEYWPDKKRVRGYIAEQVRSRREALGWSQERLARRADMSREAVRKIELAESLAGLDTLERLAYAFQCSVSDLLPIEWLSTTRVLRKRKTQMPVVAA